MDAPDPHDVPGSPGVLVRAVAESIARRSAGEKGPVGALRSVVDMVDNDEAELAVDDLVRVIAHFGIRIVRREYDDLVAAASRLDAMDSLAEVGVERFVAG
ncbi:hypothetical protein [Streptomyces lincolnensis]|nr:hypothetical protein [Streptomyces lincolnensis]QMV06237.1 hypothetical protein GJU35_11555 [Streptomyces lincolnensis]